MNKGEIVRYQTACAKTKVYELKWELIKSFMQDDFAPTFTMNFWREEIFVGIPRLKKLIWPIKTTRLSVGLPKRDIQLLSIHHNGFTVHFKNFKQDPTPLSLHKIYGSRFACVQCVGNFYAKSLAYTLKKDLMMWKIQGYESSWWLEMLKRKPKNQLENIPHTCLYLQTTQIRTIALSSWMWQSHVS